MTSPSADQTTDRTADELLHGLFSETRQVTELLGGPWTRDGEPFDPAADRPELYPAPCRSGEVANPQGMEGPLRFELVLSGPGHEDPEATLDEVVQWASGPGFEETERGQGSMPQDGDRFTALRRPDGTLLTVDVSTQRTQVAHYTACSEDPSLQEHLADPEDLSVPGNRFETGTPAPSPSDTRLGVSG